MDHRTKRTAAIRAAAVLIAALALLLAALGFMLLRDGQETIDGAVYVRAALHEQEQTRG